MSAPELLLSGVINGKVIRLDSETGLPEGQAVTVVVRPVTTAGEGIRASAGAWADAGADLEQWLEEWQRNRQQERLDGSDLLSH